MTLVLDDRSHRFPSNTCSEAWAFVWSVLVDGSRKGFEARSASARLARVTRKNYRRRDRNKLRDSRAVPSYCQLAAAILTASWWHHQFGEIVVHHRIKLYKTSHAHTRNIPSQRCKLYNTSRIIYTCTWNVAKKGPTWAQPTPLFNIHNFFITFKKKKKCTLNRIDFWLFFSVLEFFFTPKWLYLSM